MVPMVADITTSECVDRMSQCVGKLANHRIDLIENEISKLPEIVCPVTHSFTPGFYVRRTLLPAGTLLTSKIHKTRHPYIISEGDISVWTESEGVVRLVGPCTGITEPGTRRVLYAHTDTVWTTFHQAEETDVDEIEKRIIEPHDNPFLIDKEFIKLCLG